MKFTEGAFKNWGYELAEREYGEKVFTWAQYDRIAEEQGKDAQTKRKAKRKRQAKSLSKTALLTFSFSRS